MMIELTDTPPHDAATSSEASSSRPPPRRQCTDFPVIDHTAYPDIIDEVLSHRSSWLALRSTCREFRDRVDALLYAHIVLAQEMLPGGVVGTAMATKQTIVFRPHRIRPFRVQLLPPRDYHSAEVLETRLKDLIRAKDRTRDVDADVDDTDAEKETKRDAEVTAAVAAYADYARLKHLLKYTHVLDMHGDQRGLAWIPDHVPNVHTVRTWVSPRNLTPMAYKSLQARVAAPTAVLFPLDPWTNDHGGEGGIAYVGDATRKVINNIPYHVERGPTFPITARPLDGVDWSMQTALTDVVYVFQDQSDIFGATFQHEWVLPHPPPTMHLYGGRVGQAQWMSVLWNILSMVEGRMHRPPRFTIVGCPESKLPPFATPQAFRERLVQLNDEAYDPISGLPALAENIRFMTRDEYRATMSEEQFELETCPRYICRRDGVVSCAP